MIISFQALSDLFKVMSNPTRLAILSVLRDGEQCVCHIEAMLKLRQAYISQHLKVLKDANIVSVRRDGWNKYYQIVYPEIFEAMDAMYSFIRQPEPIPHIHANVNCPCPRCHPEVGEIASGQVIVSNE